MTIEEFKTHILPLKNKLFRFACSLLNSQEEAQDVVQDVMLSCWEKLEDISTVKSVEGWCMQITKNKCIDLLKAARKKDISLNDNIANHHSSQINTTDNNEGMKLLLGYLKKLPENQRLTFHLREIEGYSYKEIEKIAGMNEARVKVNLHRARKYLKDMMLKTYAYGVE